jgi:hypothetical protein
MPRCASGRETHDAEFAKFDGYHIGKGRVRKAAFESLPQPTTKARGPPPNGRREPSRNPHAMEHILVKYFGIIGVSNAE